MICHVRSDSTGAFSPREAGQGTDASRLGFFLNALGLR
jgi:hypothetical protein